MSLIGNRFTHAHVCGVAFYPRAVNNTTVDGAAIIEPWRIGRTLTFLTVGSVPAGAVMSCEVQAQLRSDDSWEDIDSSLAFTPSKLANNGVADETGCLVGELALSAVNSDTYKAVRLRFQNTNASSAIFGVSYVIGDLRHHPSGQVDDLWDKQRALA